MTVMRFRQLVIHVLSRRHSIRAGVCLLAAIVMTASAGAGPLQLHPHGKPLPTNQQGPFVTTGNGEILCVDEKQSHISKDEGKTWESFPLFKEPKKYTVSNERALLRTREGTVISAWMNMEEKNFPSGPNGWIWGGTPEEFQQWILPTYICRSTDDGKTWEEPVLLQRPWCGCIHSMIQTRSGRIVLVGQTIIPEWRHATVMYVSDDQGKSWKASNVLDYGVGRHDHAGSCEATILERADGSLYILIRTESGYFYEAESKDGLLWTNLQKSQIPSVTCCGNMYRLTDGRAALLWNHPLRRQPTNGHSREELSIAFSSDDGKTWTDRQVIATNYRRPGESYLGGWVSYPYLYERSPGEFWITTMQGGLRMKLKSGDIAKASIPLPETVVLFGDSTTAQRPGQVKQVVSDHVAKALLDQGSKLTALNRGVPSSTTTEGLARLKTEIDHMGAHVIVIQFGINDAAVDVWKNPPATSPRVSLTSFESNLREMIQLSRSKGVAPILATTNPIRWTEKLKSMYGKPPYDPASEDGFERPYLLQYNEVTRKVAAEMNVPLVDLHQAITREAVARNVNVDSFLLDGMHPNDSAHAFAAGILWPVIEAELTKRK